MPRGIRMLLVCLFAGAAAVCFVTLLVLKIDPAPEPEQSGLTITFRKYGVTFTAVLSFLAVAVAFSRQLVPPSDEDHPPDREDDFAYQRYRVRGGLALIAGAALVLVSGVDQLLHLGDDAPRSNTLLGVLGLILLAVGSVYRYDLPNIYRRVSDLEARLQRRIDALTNGHAGNGHAGNGAGPIDRN